jgi:hypothetical protein
MIQLTCTNCKMVLTIDEAFVGGACRCQHCGTIQTVPAPRTVSRRPATPGAAPSSSQAVPPSKALYQGSGPAGGEDDLAALVQAVASSGLTGTGLRSLAQRRAAGPGSGPAARPGRDHRNLIIGGIIGAAIILLAIGVTIVVALTRPASTPQATLPSQADPASAATPARLSGADGSAKPASPAMAGEASYMSLPLAGPGIVYVLDRGQGTSETFDAIKGAAYLSIRSLGPQRQFQILFWDRDNQIIATPADGLKPATEQAVEEARRVMADVFFGGQTRIGVAMQKAVEQNPAEIVIASGKYGLDDEFVKAVLDARKSSTARVHAVSLGSAGSPEALRQVAEKTGGQFREEGSGGLREYESWSPN